MNVMVEIPFEISPAGQWALEHMRATNRGGHRIDTYTEEDLNALERITSKSSIKELPHVNGRVHTLD